MPGPLTNADGLGGLVAALDGVGAGLGGLVDAGDVTPCPHGYQACVGSLHRGVHDSVLGLHPISGKSTTGQRSFSESAIRK